MNKRKQYDPFKIDIRELVIYVNDYCNKRCKHCLPKGSMVLTNDGFVTIENIVDQVKKGNDVYVLTHKLHWKKVINYICHDYDGDVFKIKPYVIPPSTMTAGHEILIAETKDRKMKMVPVENIKTGQYVFVPKPKNYSNNDDMIDISEFIPKFITTKSKPRVFDAKKIVALFQTKKTSYEIGGILNMNPSQVRALKVRYRNGTLTSEGYNRKIKLIIGNNSLRYQGGIKSINRFVDRHDLALLLGYFAAEGSVSKSKTRPNSYQVRFSFNKKETIYHKDVIRLTKKLFGIGYRFGPNGNALNIGISSSVIAHFFHKMCGSNAHDKKVPDFVFNSNLDVSIAFLKGYMRGDGCFLTANSNSRQRGFAFCTVSEQLCYGIINILMRCGILAPYAFKRNVGGNIDGRELKKTDAHFVAKFGNKARKMEDILEGVPMAQPEKYRKSPYYTEILGGWLVKIHKIEKKKYTGKVYDLTVQDDHTFISPFFAVSNCYYIKDGKGHTDVNPSWIQWVVDNFNIEKSILVGGEPLLSPRLPEVLDILKKGMKIKKGETVPAITLSTNCKWIEWGNTNNGKTLPRGPRNMEYMDVVDMLKEGSVKSLQISIEGDRETTDYIRGKDSFQNSMDVVDLLKEYDFDVFFRATYSQMNFDTIPYMLKLADEKGVDLMLFPYKTTNYFKDDEDKIPSDLTTLTMRQQEELYNTLMNYTSDDGKRLAKSEIPQYYAYIGMAGAHCPAGRERINIMPDGIVTPCEMNIPPNHFPLGKFNGDKGLDKELLMERISFFLHNMKQIDIGCMTCDHHRICRSGCHETMEYINCPLRHQIDFSVYQKDIGVSNTQLKKRISNVRQLQKKRGGC